MANKISVTGIGHFKLSPFVIAFVFLVLAILHVGCSDGDSSGSNSDNSSSGNASSATGLDFVPNTGLRIDNASNPHAGVGNDGKIYLVFEYRTGTGPGERLMASSSDGLKFDESTQAIDTTNDPRRVLMPDGFTWRYYEYDMVSQEMKSRSSTDGINFTQNQGVRYVPHESDNRTIGVYDIYIGLNDEIVMLYIGDMGGVNNVRMALSTDNGMNFTFKNGNVLGDQDAGGGGNTYVDPRTLLLPNGRRRLFTMTQGPEPTKPPLRPAGIINSFISNDHITYEIESGDRLKWNDFTEFSVLSLNDPVILCLPDGGYRMYVAAMIEESGDNKWAVVSATAKE